MTNTNTQPCTETATEQKPEACNVEKTSCDKDAGKEEAAEGSCSK